MSRILVKFGGAGLEDAASRAGLARALYAARDAGHQIILVHGGGDQIRALTGRLGIEDRYHDGLRVTDAATAEAVLMVLGGQVNRWLVHALEKAGVPAIGLTGADGGTFTARAHRPDGVDLGYVGTVDTVNPHLLNCLLEADHVPVIATVAPPTNGSGNDARHFYNINADHGAGPLAKAFAADALLFLTDVPGVLDADGSLIEQLTPNRCEELKATGVIHGGMIPKVDAALMALAALPQGKIVIAPTEGDAVVLRALEDSVGTLFCDEVADTGKT